MMGTKADHYSNHNPYNSFTQWRGILMEKEAT